MFKVEPVNVGDKPNEGDIFTITLSRNELRKLRLATGNTLPVEDYREMWLKVAKALEHPVDISGF